LTGKISSNVTAVYTSQFRNWQEQVDTNRPPERALEIDSVQLQGFFAYPFSKRVFDRGGNLLEESLVKVAAPGSPPFPDEFLMTQTARAVTVRKSVYRYQAGCFQESVDAQTRQAMARFVAQPATIAGSWAVNDAGWREWPTEVNSYRTAVQGLIPRKGTLVYQYQRLSSPRWLKSNRYLPGATNVWMAWTCSELNDSGKTLFESEEIFNAEGEASTVVAHKLNSQG